MTPMIKTGMQWVLPLAMLLLVTSSLSSRVTMDNVNLDFEEQIGKTGQASPDFCMNSLWVEYKGWHQTNADYSFETSVLANEGVYQLSSQPGHPGKTSENMFYFIRSSFVAAWAGEWGQDNPEKEVATYHYTCTADKLTFTIFGSIKADCVTKKLRGDMTVDTTVEIDKDAAQTEKTQQILQEFANTGAIPSKCQPKSWTLDIPGSTDGAPTAVVGNAPGTVTLTKNGKVTLTGNKVQTNELSGFPRTLQMGSDLTLKFWCHNARGR